MKVGGVGARGTDVIPFFADGVFCQVCAIVRRV